MTSAERLLHYAHLPGEKGIAEGQGHRVERRAEERRIDVDGEGARETDSMLPMQTTPGWPQKVKSLLLALASVCLCPSSSTCPPTQSTSPPPPLPPLLIDAGYDCVRRRECALQGGSAGGAKEDYAYYSGRG